MFKVLFNVEHVYYLPQFAPVAERMTETGIFEVYLSAGARNKAEYRRIKEFAELKGYRFIDCDSEKERRKKLVKGNFDVVVFGKSAHAGKFCSRDSLAVLLYHGIGFKKCYYTDYDPRIDVRYVESNYRAKILKSYNYRYDVVVTGFPKLDPLFCGRSGGSQTEIKKASSILYAPTFYPSSIELFAPYLLKLQEKYTVYVKPHQFTFTLKKYRRQKELLTALSRERNNIKLLDFDALNIVEYYRAVDVLITDFSSTAFEFLATEKPVVLCNFYKLRFKHRIFKRWFWNSRMDKEIFKFIDFAYIANDPRKAFELVYDVENFEKEKLPLMKKRKEMFLGRVDGKASERVVEDILRRLR